MYETELLRKNKTGYKVDIFGYSKNCYSDPEYKITLCNCTYIETEIDTGRGSPWVEKEHWEGNSKVKFFERYEDAFSYVIKSFTDYKTELEERLKKVDEVLVIATGFECE